MGTETDDPAKDKAILIYRSFLRKNLRSRPQDTRVVALLGRDMRELEAYKRLKIPLENIICLESDPDNFTYMEQNNPGFQLLPMSFQEYFALEVSLPVDQRFRPNVVSLDTEGLLDNSYISALFHVVDVMEFPGIVMTNVSGIREQKKAQRMYGLFQKLDNENYQFVVDPENDEVKIGANPQESEPVPLSDAVTYSLEEALYMNHDDMVNSTKLLERVLSPEEFSLFRSKIAGNKNQDIWGLPAAEFAEAMASRNRQRLMLNSVIKSIDLYAAYLCDFAMGFSFFLTHVDPIFIDKFYRCSYTSTTEDDMHMDMFRINRISNTEYSSTAEYLKSRFRIFPGEMICMGAIVGEESTEMLAAKIENAVTAMNKGFKIMHGATLPEREYLGRSLDYIKEEPTPGKLPEPELMSRYDLVPLKKWNALPQGYQERVEYFVDQINEQGLDAKEIGPVIGRLRWYKMDFPSDAAFGGFWDTLWLDFRSGIPLTENWCRKRMDQALNCEFPDENLDIKAGHPMYSQVHQNIVYLLDRGHPIQEIQERFTSVNPNTIRVIKARYAHPESWAK